jgi:TetR/AcrR family transcriptional regulator, fatty acid metabolism regulator protein
MRTKEGNKEQDILDAAVTVFATYGFHKAKISKIAEVADVATGSVYVYYKNKESILLKIFENLWEKLYGELKVVSETDDLSPLEKMDAMIDLVFSVFNENPSLAIVFVNEQNHLIQSNQNRFTDFYEKFLDLGQEVVEEGITKKVFSNNIDVNVFRYYLFGAIRNLLQHWAREPQKYPLESIRQNIKHLTIHGIQREP